MRGTTGGFSASTRCLTLLSTDEMAGSDATSGNCAEAAPAPPPAPAPPRAPACPPVPTPLPCPATVASAAPPSLTWPSRPSPLRLSPCPPAPAFPLTSGGRSHDPTSSAKRSGWSDRIASQSTCQGLESSDDQGLGGREEKRVQGAAAMTPLPQQSGPGGQTGLLPSPPAAYGQGLRRGWRSGFSGQRQSGLRGSRDHGECRDLSPTLCPPASVPPFLPPSPHLMIHGYRGIHMHVRRPEQRQHCRLARCSSATPLPPPPLPPCPPPIPGSSWV